MADKKETKQASFEALYEGDTEATVASLERASAATKRLNEIAKEELEKHENKRNQNQPSS